MIKLIECNKPCLKADKDKMLYNASIDTYTPKAYLFAESEEAEWVEVDASAVPVIEEEPTAEDYQTALAEMGVEV